MYSGEAVEGVEVAEDGEITQVRNMLQLASVSACFSLLCCVQF